MDRDILVALVKDPYGSDDRQHYYHLVRFNFLLLSQLVCKTTLTSQLLLQHQYQRINQLIMALISKTIISSFKFSHFC